MKERIPNMKIAYVRVSTTEQHDERQIQALEKHNIEKWFTEKISAKDTDRPELQNMLEFAREGDTIYIQDFSRLARSTKDLLDIVELLQKKKINFVSLKENVDSGTAVGKLMLTVIGAIAEFERNNLLERQKEGIFIAKQKGKYKGRKKIIFPPEWQETYGKWKHREITGAEAMKQLNLKRNTFYNLIKEFETLITSPK